MSISLRSGARRIKRLPSLKYYNVLKSKSGLTLGLKATKITNYIKKLDKSC